MLFNTNVLAMEKSKCGYLPPFKQPFVFSKNRPTPKLIELGALLFFDKRLSGNNQMSCASCHRPNRYWSDGLELGVGHDGKQLRRSTPTLINAAYNKKQFWDGRASSLEQQSTMPIESPEEMNQNLDDLVLELKAIPGYVNLFAINFKEYGITRSNISRALAAFQRSLISKNTSFDHWCAGQDDAINESAKRGFKLFEDKAECAECHSGFNFTDDKFHNVGLSPNSKKVDAGRYEISKNQKEKGAFKTPTLRNIIHTAPYMHDGSIATLTDVIEHYDEGGVKNDNIDEKMGKLNLTIQDEVDLLEFLKTLSEVVKINEPKEFPM